MDAVWPDDPPADATNALQTLVSRLRRALGDPGSGAASVGGYRLAIQVDDLDAHRFRTLAAQDHATVHVTTRARYPVAVKPKPQPWKIAANTPSTRRNFAARGHDSSPSSLGHELEGLVVLGCRYRRAE